MLGEEGGLVVESGLGGVCGLWEVEGSGEAVKAGMLAVVLCEDDGCEKNIKALTR